MLASSPLCQTGRDRWLPYHRKTCYIWFSMERKPKYQKLFESLKAEIASGRFQRKKLPSEGLSSTDPELPRITVGARSRITKYRPGRPRCRVRHLCEALARDDPRPHCSAC